MLGALAVRHGRAADGVLDRPVSAARAIRTFPAVSSAYTRPSIDHSHRSSLHFRLYQIECCQSAIV